MIGETLQNGRYEITERIGEGGFAIVYSALDTKLGRNVAIKLLNRQGAGDDFKARFQRECQWMASFNHPNIATVHDIDEHDGQPYLVMELVDGMPMIELVDRTKLDIDEAGMLALQIAETMAHTHAKGVIHRDLTLKNIMVEFDESARPVVKILDFGLAKLLHANASSTLTTIVGTPSYLSPEVIQGCPADLRTDIFAFGVCLFRMLNGRFPFESEHPTATLYLICNESAIRFEEDVTPALRDLILHCLEKDPEDRPESFHRVATELRRLLDDSSAPKESSPRYSSSILSKKRRTQERNPYVNRLMIKNRNDFFGREKEIRKIYSRLDAVNPQSISIVGERRIGKSSLLNFIYNRTSRQEYMENHASSIFVYLDFQSRTEFDIPKFIEFIFSVFRYENLKVPESEPGDNGLDLLLETVKNLHEQGKRLIILMDEFERVTRNPSFDEDFFSFLRSLANRYRVAYLTSSREGLQSMCHNKDISDSPFFNIFSTLPLSPFSRDEALQLIEKPLQDSKVSFAGHESRILDLGGHFPLYLQIACSCLYEAILDQPGEEPDWETIAYSMLRECEPHFEYLWDQIEDSEKENLARLAAEEKISPKYAFVNENLLRKGYLTERDGVVTLFSSVFKDFILRQSRIKTEKKRFWSFWK